MWGFDKLQYFFVASFSDEKKMKAHGRIRTRDIGLKCAHALPTELHELNSSLAMLVYKRNEDYHTNKSTEQFFVAPLPALHPNVYTLSC